MNGASLRAIRIAVLAMGGEGGGVLADWIADLAEHQGFIAQMTSVPGVAQRTGATIYYLELFPKAEIARTGKQPVLALMPVPGDVDIVVASELMEAARAVQRGLVTPDRTTLVGSTHRVYAMSERTALGDGRSSSDALLEACRKAAKASMLIDLAAIAESTGSVISAAMLGALAASNALPFERAAYEATITRGGVGVAASLRAFGEAYAQAGSVAAPARDAVAPAVVATTGDGDDGMPADVRRIIELGVERLVDYQDRAYAEDFLARLKPLIELDRARLGSAFRLTSETARQLALGMAYEDTIRVAELKIRPERLARVRGEVKAKPGEIVEVAEFLHPRLQEVVESVPAPLGRFIEGNALARGLVGALTRKGRIVKTTSVRGFLLLSAVARLKSRRRQSMRYGTEQQRLEDWLRLVRETAASDYDLAVEIAECRNLVKGYGDTHERGRASYEAIIAALPKVRAGAAPAATLAGLRKAALADDTGAALEAALAKLG